MKRARCGTQSGYRRHLRDGEQACESCLAANAAVVRGYRASRIRSDEDKARDRARDRARGRAVWRLAAEYPQRYRELYRAEVAREGVEP